MHFPNVLSSHQRRDKKHVDQNCIYYFHNAVKRNNFTKEGPWTNSHLLLSNIDKYIFRDVRPCIIVVQHTVASKCGHL